MTSVILPIKGAGSTGTKH